MHPDIAKVISGDPACVHWSTGDCWCDGSPDYSCAGVDDCPNGRRQRILDTPRPLFKPAAEKVEQPKLFP